MGLFDRFRRKDNNVATNTIAQKSENVQNDVNQKKENDFDRKVARRLKEMEYRNLKNRFDLYKKYDDMGIIKLSPVSVRNELDSWLKNFDEQMSVYDSFDLFTPDLVIPNFTISKDNIFYPKKNWEKIVGLVDYGGLPDKSFEEYFEVINPSDELVSVSQMQKMHDESERKKLDDSRDRLMKIAERQHQMLQDMQERAMRDHQKYLEMQKETEESFNRATGRSR